MPVIARLNGFPLLAGLGLLWAAVWTAPGVWAAPYPSHLAQVGSARLQVLWFHIYDATLYSADGTYEPGQRPVLLDLAYQRNIPRQRILEETRAQLDGKLPAAALEAGLQALAMLLPDIQKGESIAFYLTADGDGRFYHNRQLIGVVEQPRFNHAMLDIWLAEDSQYPDLARRLRGDE